MRVLLGTKNCLIKQLSYHRIFTVFAERLSAVALHRLPFVPEVVVEDVTVGVGDGAHGVAEGRLHFPALRGVTWNREESKIAFLGCRWSLKTTIFYWFS